MRRLLLASALIVLAAGCATTPAEKVEAAQGAEDAGKRAQTVLRRGDEALAANNYEEAARNYEFVRVTFPYLSAATEAELRLADVDYQSDMWVGARERYDTFIKLHPTSPRVDYAAYRSALTWYRQIPGDFFLLPSSTQKDQAAVQGARRELQKFLEQYPQSEYAPEAKKALDDTDRRLAEHELYAANFYAKAGRWKAVALRLETLIERFPNTVYAPRAMLDLSDAYARLGRADEARAALEKLVQTHPDTPEGKKAKKQLGSKPAEARPAEVKPAEPAEG